MLTILYICAFGTTTDSRNHTTVNKFNYSKTVVLYTLVNDINPLCFVCTLEIKTGNIPSPVTVSYSSDYSLVSHHAKSSMVLQLSGKNFQ